MKLTKAQINALSHKISDQIQNRRTTRIEEEREKICKSNEYKSLLLDVEAIFRKLKEFHNTTSLDVSFNLGTRYGYGAINFQTDVHELAVEHMEDYVNSIINKMKLPNGYIDPRDVADDIVLAAMDATDITAITDKIIANYD